MKTDTWETKTDTFLKNFAGGWLRRESSKQPENSRAASFNINLVVCNRNFDKNWFLGFCGGGGDHQHQNGQILWIPLDSYVAFNGISDPKSLILLVLGAQEVLQKVFGRKTV